MKKDFLNLKRYTGAMKTSLYSLNLHDWNDFFNFHHVPHAHRDSWFRYIYRDSTQWHQQVSSTHKNLFLSSFSFELPQIQDTKISSDGTVKFLVRFSDGREVESVLIPFYKRYSICLSTQVGCGMNCSFCFTATQGLKRNLTCEEIVGQYIVVRKWFTEKSPGSLSPSIVFMGQGEPLHNLDHVKKAIEIFIEPKLIGLGVRQITLSTSGYLPGMSQLINYPRINLALSLHSPFNHERDQLIPINKKYPLEKVLEKLDELPLLPRQFFNFEYLMIKNFNISVHHAAAIEQLLKKRKAIINLIPFNPYPGSNWERPSVEEIDQFKKELVQRGVRTMLRSTKGHDILAACGQLNVNQQKANYV